MSESDIFLYAKKYLPLPVLPGDTIIYYMGHRRNLTSGKKKSYQYWLRFINKMNGHRLVDFKIYVIIKIF
jgi:hypothetical protein